MTRSTTKRAHPVDECTPVQCQSSFDTLDMSINKLGMLVEKIDDRMDLMGERMAAQEAHAKEATHKLDSMNASFHRLAEQMRREVQDHSTSCPGREYALRKIKSASMAPPPVASGGRAQDATGSFLMDAEFRQMAVKALDERGKGFAILRWVIYLGVVIGVALAAGAYAAGKLLGG